jgi:hypothetical protein
MDPVKALGKAGVFSGRRNRIDGNIDIQSDLDDYWTAKYHKAERTWFIEDLQDLAAEKSVRVTILRYALSFLSDPPGAFELRWANNTL